MWSNISGVISDVNGMINEWVWGVPMLVLILSTGILMTFRTKFFQIRRAKDVSNETFLAIFKNRAVTKTKDKKAISQFQALSTALAATIGTGNIAGVATAITVGGPGAIFWMWVSAFFGMMTNFSENVLGIFYRRKNSNNEWSGGAMYYINDGLGAKKNMKTFAKVLACLFAVFCILASFGIGNMTQINSIADAMHSNFGISTLITGVVLAIVAALVVVGGIKRIGQVTEKLVPFMALFYIVLAIGVILLNLNRIPSVFVSILEGAFRPSAVTGGIVGSMLMSVKKGVSRGIFSNEAGLGTGSIAHACADTKKPVKQGMFGIFEVFTDTIVICTLTALVILCSGTSITYGQAAGAELTISGFTLTYGNWVSLLTAFAMCCFAFSTILGWGLYGARCIEFLFSERITKYFMAAYALVAILGATANLGLMWSIAETFNGLMAIPNLIALFLLSGKVVELTKEYFSGEGKTR